MRVIDKDTENQIRSLVAKGKTVNAIATQLGMGWANVNRIIAELGERAATNPGGRPSKYSDERIVELVEAFERYIEKTEIPIVAEFAALNKMHKNYFYDRTEFSNLIKECVSKKEAALERGGLTGSLNPTVAIFSLKQLGWRDRQEVESTTLNTNHNINEDVSKMSPDERRKRIDELMRKRLGS